MSLNHSFIKYFTIYFLCCPHIFECFLPPFWVNFRIPQVLISTVIFILCHAVFISSNYDFQCFAFQPENKCVNFHCYVCSVWLGHEWSIVFIEQIMVLYIISLICQIVNMVFFVLFFVGRRKFEGRCSERAEEFASKSLPRNLDFRRKRFHCLGQKFRRRSRQESRWKVVDRRF